MKKKKELSLSVYNAIKQSPTKGRFLEECGLSGKYIVLDETVATRKISQCFRERQRVIKSNLTAKNVNHVSMERQVLRDYVTVRIDYFD
jgi:hypothetical protein